MNKIIFSFFLILLFFTNCDLDTTSSNSQNLIDDFYKYKTKSEEDLHYIRKSSDQLGAYSRTTLENLRSVIENTDSINKQSRILLSYLFKIDVINNKSDSLLYKTDLILYRLDEMQSTTNNINNNVENINRILTSEKWDELVDGLHRMLRVLQHFWTAAVCLILLFLGYFFKPNILIYIEKIQNKHLKKIIYVFFSINESLIKSLSGISFATIILNYLSKFLY